MSAQITREICTSDVWAAYLSPSGRAYCTTCHHEAGLGNERCASDTTATRWDASEICDNCGALLTESIETIEAWSDVEHIPVKIF